MVLNVYVYISFLAFIDVSSLILIRYYLWHIITPKFPESDPAAILAKLRASSADKLAAASAAINAIVSSGMCAVIFSLNLYLYPSVLLYLYLYSRLIGLRLSFLFLSIASDDADGVCSASKFISELQRVLGDAVNIQNLKTLSRAFSLSPPTPVSFSLFPVFYCAKLCFRCCYFE